MRSLAHVLPLVPATTVPMNGYRLAEPPGPSEIAGPILAAENGVTVAYMYTWRLVLLRPANVEGVGSARRPDSSVVPVVPWYFGSSRNRTIPESPAVKVALALGLISIASSKRQVPVIVPSVAKLSLNVSMSRMSHCGPIVSMRRTFTESIYGAGL